MGFIPTPLTIADKKLLRGEIPTKEEYDLSHKQIMEHCNEEINSNNIKTAIVTFALISSIIILLVILLIK